MDALNISTMQHFCNIPKCDVTCTSFGTSCPNQESDDYLDVGFETLISQFAPVENLRREKNNDHAT